jgi:hypothetical protein
LLYWWLQLSRASQGFFFLTKSSINVEDRSSDLKHSLNRRRGILSHPFFWTQLFPQKAGQAIQCPRLSRQKEHFVISQSAGSLRVRFHIETGRLIQFGAKESCKLASFSCSASRLNVLQLSTSTTLQFPTSINQHSLTWFKRRPHWIVDIELNSLDGNCLYFGQREGESLTSLSLSWWDRPIFILFNS